MIYTANYDSPMGEILLASKEGALIGLWFTDQKYFLGSLKEPMEQKSDEPVLHDVQNWLDRYFAGEKPDISELHLAPEGSAFRSAIWDILCQIPYGETMTYGEISKQVAAQFGKEHMSAQAVGGAVGHNPISVIIPCHRVVGASGSLTGYAGGINRKIRLLAHEGVNVNNFFVPTKSTAP